MLANFFWFRENRLMPILCSILRNVFYCKKNPEFLFSGFSFTVVVVVEIEGPVAVVEIEGPVVVVGFVGQAVPD